MMVEVSDVEAAAMEMAAADDEACEVEEVISMEEDDSYLELLLQCLAIAHSITSLSMLIAYYCLKVSLNGFSPPSRLFINCQML